LHEYLNDTPNNDIQKDSGVRPLIPLDLKIDLDGIGGIYVGNAITVSPVSHGGILPNRYHDKVVFQVTDVTHTIQRFDWQTSVNGMMRMISFE